MRQWAPLNETGKGGCETGEEQEYWLVDTRDRVPAERRRSAVRARMRVGVCTERAWRRTGVDARSRRRTDALCTPVMGQPLQERRAAPRLGTVWVRSDGRPPPL